MAAQAQQQTLPPSPHSTTSTTSKPVEVLYHAISSYPFDSDPSYQSGLASILGHPGSSATPQEITEKPQLVLRAKCFYYTRKFNTPPVEVQKYAAWLNTQQAPVATDSSGERQQRKESTTSNPDTQANARTVNPTVPTSLPNITSTQTTQATQEPPPPYPTSFADIIELITNNKPIPGIQEIPTTVLEPGSSKRDNATRRRKPWEKDSDDDDADGDDKSKIADVSDSIVLANAEEASAPAAAVAAPGRPSKGGGVAHILQPEAIPERTLVADD